MSEFEGRIVTVSRPRLDAWQAVKPITDGIVTCKDYELCLNSPKFERETCDLLSHFKALLVHECSYTILKSTHFEWVARGDQDFNCGVPDDILERTHNVLADPRLACGAVLLFDPSEDIMIGFLFTRQVIYAITGRHPLPCFENYKDWQRKATIDEYANMRAFDEWSDRDSHRMDLISWDRWRGRYDVLCLKEEYIMWKRRCFEPDWWCKWMDFRNCDKKAHLGLVELAKREDECEFVNIAIDVEPSGGVIWSVNGMDLFKQPQIGSRLLDRYAALELGGLNRGVRPKRFTPALATMTLPDLVLPERKLDPIFPIVKKYYSPIRGKDGGLFRLKSDSFLSGCESELFGQGASICLKGYAFDSVLVCDKSRKKQNILEFEQFKNCEIPCDGRIDLRKLDSCC